MAVYTEVSDEDIRQFVGEYDLGFVVSCKGIAEGIENSNYLLETERGHFIVTLYEKRVRAEDLPFFLKLMEHLAGMGISCPIPVRGRDGEALRRLCGKPAAIVTFLKGMWPRRASALHCAALGRSLAEMHAAGASFPLQRPNDLSLEGWRRLFALCGARGEEIRVGLADELAIELDWLAATWPVGLPSGLIHADLFPDNVFFLGNRLSGIIDFYFACNDFLAYDVAVCLNAWCFETDGSFNATNARAFLSSYDSLRRLTSSERDALPILARGAALRFLLTRLYDWINTAPDTMVRRKNPLEFLGRLRFHRTIKSGTGYDIGRD